MMFFLIYVVIAAAAGTVFDRMKDWKSWSKDSKLCATVGFSVFWPGSIPLALTIMGTNKVLDKFTKV